MFPSLPLAALTPVDYALIALLLVAHPVSSFLSHRRENRRKAAGRPSPRMKRYLTTLVTFFVLTVLVAAGWAYSGRPWADVGFDAAPDLNFLLGAGAAVLASAAMCVHAIQVLGSEKQLAELSDLMQRMGSVDEFIPRTRAERGMFNAVSVNAGFTEEFIYRGYLIWALAHWLPVWAAAIAALAIFIALHAYQESWNAIARVAFAGAVFTVLTVLSGSLLPAMLLHAVVDLTSGAMASAARRRAASA